MTIFGNFPTMRARVNVDFSLVTAAAAAAAAATTGGVPDIYNKKHSNPLNTSYRTDSSQLD